MFRLSSSPPSSSNTAAKAGEPNSETTDKSAIENDCEECSHDNASIFCSERCERRNGVEKAPISVIKLLLLSLFTDNWDMRNHSIFNSISNSMIPKQKWMTSFWSPETGGRKNFCQTDSSLRTLTQRRAPVLSSLRRCHCLRFIAPFCRKDNCNGINQSE